MLTFTARLKVLEGKQDAFFETMKSSLRAIREEPGNLAFYFHRVKDDPRSFFFYEQWRDKDALDAHNVHLVELGIRLSEIKEDIAVEYFDLIPGSDGEQG